jgi:hypothetical protein
LTRRATRHVILEHFANMEGVRKRHRKVRTGCTECRRRRVKVSPVLQSSTFLITSSVPRLTYSKCDERRPQCKNCTRNMSQCSLLFLTSLYTTFRETSVAVVPPQRSSPKICLPPASASFSSLGFQVGFPALDNRSQELLHHYISVVYKTTTNDHAIKTLGSEIHRLAFIHPFLMSGRLAVSALHLAHRVPARSRELAATAIKEEHTALQYFRAALAEVNSNNIHAVFSFSTIVIPYIMASTLTDKYDSHFKHLFATMRRRTYR